MKYSFKQPRTQRRGRKWGRKPYYRACAFT